MNILLVSQMNTDSPTGVTTYYLSLRDEYIKQGHQVTIITTKETPIFISIILKIFNRSTLIFRSPFYKLWINEFFYFTSIYFAVKKNRKKNNWHIIHGQDPNSSCAAKFGLNGKIPVVTTCHFNDNPVIERQSKYSLSHKGIARVTKWFKFLFSKVDNYIFISNYNLKKSSYLLDNKINGVIIPNGVKFRKKKEVENGPSCFIISNIGTLEERKNQILLIEAASDLKKRGLYFNIWLFGDGPKRKEWEKKVEEAGLKEYITFWGHQKNILEIVKKSNLYVHTAKNENCSICILEALSVGLPVLALANGGIPEQFPESLIGLLAPNTNSSQLANEIHNCFQADILRQLQDQQYEYAASRFTIEKMIKNTLDFYSSILNNKFSQS